jgi:hypothetical protein
MAFPRFKSYLAGGHALDVIVGLRKRDAFDPVDWIDLGMAGIAVTLNPFLDPAAAQSRLLNDTVYNMQIGAAELADDIGPLQRLQCAGIRRLQCRAVVNSVSHALRPRQHAAAS